MIIDTWIHPSVILICGAFLLPFIKGYSRRTFLVLIPVLAFINVWQYTPEGVYGITSFLDWQLIFGRIDKLSQVFAYIMTLMCIIGTIYGLHVDGIVHGTGQWVMSMVYLLVAVVM